MFRQVTPNHQWHSVEHFAPLLATCVVLITSGLFSNSFLQCTEPGCGHTFVDLKLILQGIRPEAAPNVFSYVDRVTWTLAGGLHLLVSFAALLASAFVIYERLGRYRRLERWVFILVTIFFAADVGLYVSLRSAADVSGPAQRLLRLTVGHALPEINLYNRRFDALGLTVGLTLAVAACTVLWSNTGEEQDERKVARQMRLLRVILYAGSAALVIGVLRLSTSFNWAKDFWAEGSAAGKEASSLITGIISSLGIMYTLILAAAYLPAALVLRARARALASDESPATQDEWLKERGLAISYTEYLPRVLAILGPFLAGPIADLIKNLSGTLTG